MKHNKALLIIDVQVAMFTYEGGNIYHGEELLNNIEALVEKARELKIPIIYIQHTKSDPKHEFAAGAPTWQIHPQIAPRDGEAVIQKTICDAFYKTSLHEVLQEQGIDTLYITGLQTDYCVDTTCRSANSKDYHTILISDAQSTFDSQVLSAEQIIQHHLDVLGAGMVTLKTTKEVINGCFG